MELANIYRNKYDVAEGDKPADANIPHELVAIETIGKQEPLAVQDTAKMVKDSVPPKPTYAQIRNRNWYREKKLLVGGSRYIEPKKDVELVSSIKVENGTFSLPIRERNSTNTDWLTIILLIATILVASVRISYSKYVKSLFQSLVNYSTSFRMFGEKNYSILHGAFRLELLFYITFSIFVYHVIHHFQLTLVHQKLSLYLSSFIFVLLYYFGKKIVYSALGLIFEGTAETKEYLFNVDNFNRSLGLVLFPIVALINYYPANNPVNMVIAGIFIVVVFYIFLIQRGISILLRKQFSIFYLFLYLCTLEFLPLLLLYKVVVL